MRKICKNCPLYNAGEGVCDVVVVHEGEYYELRVSPSDRCHWEDVREELEMVDGEDQDLPIKFAGIRYDLDNATVHVESPSEVNPFA